MGSEMCIRDSFELIANHLTAQEIITCIRVCANFKLKIEGSPRLQSIMRFSTTTSDQMSQTVLERSSGAHINPLLLKLRSGKDNKMPSLVMQTKTGPGNMRFLNTTPQTPSSWPGLNPDRHFDPDVLYVDIRFNLHRRPKSAKSPCMVVTRNALLNNMYFCQPETAVKIHAFLQRLRSERTENYGCVKLVAGSTFGDVLDALDRLAERLGWCARV